MNPSTELQTEPSTEAEVRAGMACVDTSGNARIPVLMEMVGAISRARDPGEVLREFASGLHRLQTEEAYISLSTRGLPPGQYRITRMLLDPEADHIDDVDPWSEGDSIAVNSGGLLGAIIRQAYPEIIHNLQLEDDPVVGDALKDFHSLMAIPLFDNGEPLNWSISLRRDPEGFTIEELEDAILRNNLVGSTVRNVLARQEITRAHEAIRQEVHRIAAIQRALLPERMPDIAGLSLAASYETFDTAGGDYYDFIPLGHPDGDGKPDPDGPWGMLIADASGHGPAAAVMMAMLHAILHAYPYVPGGPAEVLQHTNAHLCEKRIEGSFITAFFAIYDPKTRTLTYARAGHNPPLVKNPGAGGSVHRLDDVGGLPMGIVPAIEYEESSVTLAPGQSLVLYTDGITEAMNPAGTMFGIDGIEQALVLCTGEPECVVGSVGDALRQHESNVQPSDDQTLVIARVDSA